MKTKSQQVRLTKISKSGAGKPGPKPAQCHICLADEVSLKNGICKDRAACEERQPPLIPVEEL